MNTNGVLITSYQKDQIINGIKECYAKDWNPKIIRDSISQYTWQQNKVDLIATLESKT